MIEDLEVSFTYKKKKYFYRFGTNFRKELKGKDSDYIDITLSDAEILKVKEELQKNITYFMQNTKRNK